ncbi:MAG: PadR family transcriptional regulator [Haloquadratum sp.]|jgi:DNA-binding PadR family transcriptional regulator|nr:PadR family transcriptional regulator [Haloferacaceae archaeon]MDR9444597.1 PadR family transcriptional regulator [Haloquadratum sp.]
MSEAQTQGTQVVGTEDLTAFQQNILIILAREPMYGLAIKRNLQRYYDDEVNHGRLYPNLDDLVDAGLVEKSELDKRTNQYALTDVGYGAIIDRLRWVFSQLVTDRARADELCALVDEQA